MAQLKTLLGSLLRDVIRAQYEADRYSLSLREASRADGDRDFRVPGAQLGDLELELQYAVRRTDVPHEETETDYAALRRFVDDLTRQLARSALTAAATVASAGATERPEELELLLRQEEELDRGFGPFLARQIGEGFLRQTATVLKPDGGLETATAMRIVMRRIDTYLLDNPDLRGLFDGREGAEQLRRRARAQIETVLTALLTKRAADYRFTRRQVFTSQELLITTDELKKVPPTAIQKLRLHISPRSFRPDDPLADPETDE